MKLMIVDDHAGLRKLIRQLVASRFDVVCECASGSEAVLMALTFQPDWVTMDVRMAGGGGFEAMRVLRVALPSAHIVVVSTFDQIELREEAKAAGAVAYLTKDNLTELGSVIFPSGGLTGGSSAISREDS